MGGDNLSRLPAQDIARLNKELSELEPVVEALAGLRAKQAEARGLLLPLPAAADAAGCRGLLLLAAAGCS